MTSWPQHSGAIMVLAVQGAKWGEKMRFCDCHCEICARNAILPNEYYTPGEVDDVCFICEECKLYDGDCLKSSQQRHGCAYYLEPQKLEDVEARDKRRCFRVIKGGKNKGVY